CRRASARWRLILRCTKSGLSSRPSGFHSRSGNNTRRYLALNPEGKVPTLLVDGHPLTEVAAILYYLARRFPTADLFPADDLEAQAHVISWMSLIASTIHPARRVGGVQAEHYFFEGSVERWKQVFEIAETRLGRRDWAIGSYSIADIHLFRLYWRFVELIRRTPETFPGLSAHYDRMMARRPTGYRNRARRRILFTAMKLD